MTAPRPKEGTRTATTDRRIGPALILGGVVLACLILGGWLWVGFVFAVFFIGFQELSAIMKVKQIYPSKTIVYTSGILFILAAAFGKTQYFQPILTLSVITSFFRLLFRQPRASISDIGATLLAIFYIAFLPAHFILLRNIETINAAVHPLIPPGIGYILFMLLVISASDIGAYYAGKRFGIHLLYPEISPKKTREGALGGLLAGLLIGIAFSFFIDLPIWHAIPLSLLLVVTGQLGDLAESLLKRDAGVKDSGVIFHGHGGVLDRMDSYIFCGAVSYYYIHWIILKEGLVRDLGQMLPGWL
jgi:phosphatidate cytidylyltransferase